MSSKPQIWIIAGSPIFSALSVLYLTHVDLDGIESLLIKLIEKYLYHDSWGSFSCGKSADGNQRYFACSAIALLLAWSCIPLTCNDIPHCSCSCPYHYYYDRCMYMKIAKTVMGIVWAASPPGFWQVQNLIGTYVHRSLKYSQNWGILRTVAWP